MNIKGKRIKLRAIELKDSKLLKDMVNSSEIESKIVGWSTPISDIDQEEWIKSIRNDSNNLRLIIENEDGIAIGLSIIRNIDWKNRTAIHGIKISENKFRGLGYGKEVVDLTMSYCFEELNLNRISTTILETNIPSLNLYINKCKWIKEGVERKAIFKNNKYIDKIILGILREEYFGGTNV